jgi:hypothetical protein
MLMSEFEIKLLYKFSYLLICIIYNTEKNFYLFNNLRK